MLKKNVCSGGEFSSGAIRQNGSGGDATGYHDTPGEPSILRFFPLAGDFSMRGIIGGLHGRESFVGDDLHGDFLVGILDAADMAGQEAGYRAVCVMIEAVHRGISETFCMRITVPAFPNGSGTLFY